jgi:hypothetical protein
MGDTKIERSVDDMLTDILGKGFPSVACTLDWLEERLANSLRLADEKNGNDRAGWVEDAAYYAKTLAILRTLSGTPPPAPQQH